MFSIVICSYNKVESLKAVLKSLNNLEAKELFEVQLIIDGSTDGTIEMVKSIKTLYSFQYHFIKNSGLTAARNYGVRHSQRDYVLFCDDDVIFHPLYIKNLSNSVKDNPANIHIGDIVNIDKRYSKNIINNFISEGVVNYETFQSLTSPHIFFEGIKTLYAFKDKYQKFQPSVWWAVVTGGNLCVPKKYFTNIGYFDSEIQGWGPEDADLCYRFFLKGVKATFNKGNSLYHLDHERNHNNLLNSMTKNAVYFIKKYNKPKELYAYLNFSNGKISLKEFNDLCGEIFNHPKIEIPEFYLSMKDYSKKEQILKIKNDIN